MGSALDYEHIAMLFVEVDSATLAVVDIADGSIVDLHRQSLKNASVAAELVTMVAGLDAPSSRADGVFVVGCGVDIVGIKPALEAATSLVVSVPEEPELALARGAALASANAPLFASTTSALAYALDPGTGEVNPRALGPSYLDVCAVAGVSEGALAYSAVDDEHEAEHHGAETRRRPLALVTGAVAGVAAVAAGMLIVSLAADVRPTAAQQTGPRDSVETPAGGAPATELPAQVLLPGMSSAPAPRRQRLRPSRLPCRRPRSCSSRRRQSRNRPAQAPAYMAPAPQPRRAPDAAGSPAGGGPVPQAPPPAAAAAGGARTATRGAGTPVMTAYLHLPFFSIPIPINPPPPPPPAPAGPAPSCTTWRIRPVERRLGSNS